MLWVQQEQEIPFGVHFLYAVTKNNKRHGDIELDELYEYVFFYKCSGQFVH
jgi:hypothetical protein